MWVSRTKADLAIEVWEKLDCESVGAVEIEAIQAAVAGAFGDAAVDSPMKIARQLADEGAILRHPEILKLFVRQELPVASERELRDEIDLTSLVNALRSIRILEKARANLTIANDKEGLRQLRSLVLEAKKRVNDKIQNARSDNLVRQMNIEITEWLSHWLQVPTLFENWVQIRIESPDFRERFGSISESNDA